MKKVVIFFLIALATYNVANCRYKLTKIWEYGYGEKRGWVFYGKDEWNGDNYWCVGPGNSCGKWDWKAEYWVEGIGQNPTPPHTNTPEFGQELVKKAAKEKNMVLPPDLGLPEFETIWEEENDN